MLQLKRRLYTAVTRARLWTDSVEAALDAPAAVLLSICRYRPPRGPSLSARCFRRLFPQLTVHPRELRGFSLALDPADKDDLLIYDEVFVQGVYDPALVPFEPDTVIDCGAFTGSFTLLARSRFPEARFLAFEPHCGNYAAMCSNFRRNCIEIEVRNQAVSNRSGEMFFSGDGVGGHLDSQPGSRRVQVVHLRDVIAHLSPHRLLLKMDVEGEEVRIIPDIVAILPATCAIFFETHSGDEGFRAMERIFLNAGFKVQRNRSHGDAYVDAFALRCSGAELE